MDFTELEKEIIKTMLSNMSKFIEMCDGYLDIHGDSFSRNDLYDLATKLGVENYY